MNKYKKISIEEIPSGNYEGYYWFSDESKPVVIRNKDIDKSIFKKLPFVVEANFYSKQEDISIQVKNIDGDYHVAMIDVKDTEAKKYVGHDIGCDFLLVEAWEDKKDPLLENMTTKVPTWAAFKGFIELSKTNKDD